MNCPLYTVQKLKADDTPSGKVHLSDDADRTLCGKYIDSKWFITVHQSILANCPKCQAQREGRKL